MKKHLTLLICSFIFLFMFAVPGNSAKAAELQTTTTFSGIQTKISNPAVSSNECGCTVKPILGSERNKMVADLISSDEFKNVKMTALEMGYQWLGAGKIEIIDNITYGFVLTGVPFTKDGKIFMFVFIGGTLAGVTPME